MPFGKLFALLAISPLLTAGLPAEALADIGGKSVHLVYRWQHHICNASRCKWGNRIKPTINIYISKDRKTIYDYSGNNSGYVYKVGIRDKDGILYTVNGNTITFNLTGSDGYSGTMTNTISGSTCSVNMRTTSPGVTLRYKIWDVSCKVSEGNIFAR
ncbi:MAG: hypothetical protein BroJett030_03160 [Alphaproteobacteria bacterium]|nr:MAG: hypothetical protein BroJett030_03160 [Alphaproteobacteria bacterium]